MQIGRKIIHLSSVDSTNNYVANLLKQGKIESGAVILADDQFAGRGQRANSWVTKAGENLTFSIFINNVNLSVEDQFRLTQFTSLCLIKLLEKHDIRAEVKWPNDIFVEGKKVSGVLIENQIGGSTIKSAIIGIGLNVNQTDFKEFSATSLRIIKDHTIVIMNLLMEFIEIFNSMYLAFMNSPFEQLNSFYHEHLYLRNIKAQFEDSNGLFKGVIEGVNENGLLKIKKDEGVQLYSLKEIAFMQ